MTPAEIREEIARFCGWERKRIENLPDGTAIFESSLDAITEAEAKLSRERYEYRWGTAVYSSSPWQDYNQLLLYGNQPCRLDDGKGKHDMGPPSPKLPHLAGGITATAPQRAEALLRTIGRWRE
jgi:hypothetical protein